MGRLNRETGEIHAKIVYYGPAGAGKSANLQLIQRKLKREHRGELRTVYATDDKKGAYEFLPVRLGAVRGFQTSIHLHTVPGPDRFKDERRQILADVDGVVFVGDLRPGRHEATVKSLAELEEHLQSYGRSFDDVLLVVQYNRGDEAAESDLEKLHARLGVKPEAHFEGIATEGTGVLQCLTTLSKAILARLRKQAEEEPEIEAEAEPEPPSKIDLEVPIRPTLEPVTTLQAEPQPGPAQRGATMVMSAEGGGFTLEASGPAHASGGELRIPVRLVEEGSGRKIELSLLLTLES
jgi:signal recognition particle receptor subunit beta